MTGNDCFTSHPGKEDWYETVKLNYGVFYQGGGEKQFNPIPSTWLKMMYILHFWARKGVDAFRVDMAEMVPVEFWRWLIPNVHTFFPEVEFMGEVYNPLLYRDFIAAGFNYLYDKVGMYDYLRGVTTKAWSAEGITQHWQAVDDIRDKMVYFLENHDEQRIASGFFCGSGRCAEPAMTVAATLGTNPVLIWAGQELGEKGMDLEGFSGVDGRTSIFDYWGVKSLQAWANHGKFDGANLSDEQRDLRTFYQRLLCLARDNKALNSGQMYDLEYVQGEGFDRHEQFTFLRKYENEVLLVVVNFDDKPRDISVTIPEDAFKYLKQPAFEDAKYTDLLTGEQLVILDANNKKVKTQPFMPSMPIKMKIDAWTGVVLQVKDAAKKPKK